MTKGKVYLWLQAAACIALAAFLSFSAVGIFREGSARKAENPTESIYTPQDTADKLVQAAPLALAGAALLITGLALGLKDENAEKPVKDASLKRDLLSARVIHPSGAMIAEQRTQKRLKWIGGGLFLLCMVPVLVYLLQPAHFPPDDLEGMFFGLMKVFLPWTAAGLSALSVTSVLSEKSVLKEIRAAEEQLKEEKEEGSAAAAGEAGPAGKKGMLQAALIIAAIVFIIAGVLNGSARDVLYKAVTICTECVGLG